MFVIFVLIFPFGGIASDTTLTPVKLQLKWKHQFQFAGYYAAIEKGYYHDAGLSVELIEASEAKVPADEVVNGNADFGVCTSDVVLMRSDGKPVVVLATIFQHSPLVLLANDSSGIRYVHDLVGKRLMIEPHAADLIAYMNDEGITLKQVQNVPHTFDVNMLVDNKIDAMTAYVTDEPFVLQQHGAKYHIFSPTSGGIDFYGDVLITTEEMVQKQPKLVENFRAASIKGWEYAMENPDEIIDLIYTKYSQRHSKEHLLFEADKMKNLIEANVVEIGYTNRGRWQRIIDVYKQTKMLDNDVSVDGLLYSDYIKAKTSVPVKFILIFILTVLFVGSLALFFYRLSNRLKLEIVKGNQIQKSLTDSQEKLLNTNEQLRELSKFKEDMTNMIIHDLKSPLNAIVNVKQFKDEEVRLNLVQKAGYKMLNLVRNVLDVYKYENAEIELSKTKVILNDIIEKSIDEVSYSARQRMIEIEQPVGFNYILDVDELLIRRVFVNLLTNAIKYSPIEGVIKISAEAEGENVLKIKISNTGEGIPEEMQTLIFEKFGQAKNHMIKGMHSSGLGLAFCKMAVEAHEGKIGVVSTIDEGAEFWFTLPNCLDIS